MSTEEERKQQVVKLSAKARLLREALDQRNETISSLKSSLREVRSTLAERNEVVRELKAVAKRSASVKHESWLGNFATSINAFSVGVQAISDSLPPPSVLIAHELLSLQAAIAVPSAEGGIAVFDNVEHPLYGERVRAVGQRRASRDTASDSAIAAFTATALNDRFNLAVCSSPGQMEALTQMGTDIPMDVLLNCRATARRQVEGDRNIRTEAGVSEGERLLLYLNNAYPDAGVEESISTLGLVGKVSLAFLGESRLGETTLGDLIRDSEHHERISELQPVASDELVAYVAGADVVLIPLLPVNENYRTCLPNRLFEAIAARRPCVAHASTAVGRLIMDEGIGAVFEEASAPAIAKAVQRVLDMDANSLSRSLQRAADRYTWAVESESFFNRLKPYAARGGPAFLLANKRLDANNRLHRMTKSLGAIADVHVFAVSMPQPGLIVPGVEYHIIETR